MWLHCVGAGFRSYITYHILHLNSLSGFISRAGAQRRAGAGGGSTRKTKWKASASCSYHNHHLNSLFQDLHQDVVHQVEPKQEVGVPGGQGDRLKVIVNITFIIWTFFSEFTLRSGSPSRAKAGGGSTWSTEILASLHCFLVTQPLIGPETS